MVSAILALYWLGIRQVSVCLSVCLRITDLWTFSPHWKALNFSLPFSPCLSLRLQRRGDGGRPRQAAGVPWDLVRVIPHSALAGQGEGWCLQQHHSWVGPSGSNAAHWRAGSGPAVCPSGDHAAGHPQHRVREVRKNTAMYWTKIYRMWKIKANK